MLNKSAGTKFLHVPYKGVAPVLNALTGNEIQLSVGSSGVAGGLLRAGKVKALALAAKQRSPLFPDVPTTTEMGHPEILAFIWFGLAAPAGTPQADRRQDQRRRARDRDAARLHRALHRHAGLDDASPATPAETDEIIRSELPIIRDMSAAAGVKPQ